MNYGKDNLSKRKSSVSSKKTMQKKRVGVRFFKALIICILLLIVIAAGAAGFFVKRVIDDAPSVTPETVKPKDFASTIVTEDGTVLGEFKQAGSNRKYKTIDEMPEYLGQAFVAIEDERFYEHNGIDLQGILRAFVVGIRNGNFSEGASTITQQLIKNNVFPDFVNENTFYQSLERKLQEQYLAVNIEKQMTKDEILEAYMNTINLGQNCLGVQSAAKRYFGKDVSELTLSECAVIAGITQSPADYDPVDNPENNKTRRDIVLNNMLEQGYITQAEYDEAIADDVYARVLQTPPAEDTQPYSYFVDAIAEQVIDDLCTRRGYTETQAYNALYSGGLTIISTQDPTIQQICDEEVNNDAVYPYGTEYGLEYALTIHRADGTVENYSKEMLAAYIQGAWGREYPLDFYSADEAYAAVEEYKSTLGITENDTIDESIDVTPQPQVSVVVMEQSTGKVKAIVGGRGEKKTSLSLNRATDTTRQPGSCFKILSTYAPALDACGYTLATSIDDKGPYTYANGETAENWDKIYLGSARMRYAIEHSMNVCALNTLTAIGPQTGYDYLLKFGFTTLVNYDNENYEGYTDVAPATALGGITRGVYNLEMTAAYAAIANNGSYIKPILYTQILDQEGNVLIDNTQPETQQIIKDSTAALLTSAMQDVINKGTGTAAKLNNMPAAGKTGTTENSRDLWLSAYTPYYTASVWTGYDSNKPMENQYSQTFHEVIWKNIMDRINTTYNLAYQEFTMPSSVQQKTICTQTGLLAVSGCPTLTEYFAEGTVPTQSCSGHRVVQPKVEKEDEKENTDDNEGNTSDGNTNTGGGDSNGEGDSNTGGSDSNTGGDANTGGGDSNGGGDSKTGGGDSNTGGDATTGGEGGAATP